MSLPSSRWVVLRFLEITSSHVWSGGFTGYENGYSVHNSRYDIIHGGSSINITTVSASRAGKFDRLPLFMLGITVAYTTLFVPSVVIAVRKKYYYIWLSSFDFEHHTFHTYCGECTGPGGSTNVVLWGSEAKLVQLSYGSNPVFVGLLLLLRSLEAWSNVATYDSRYLSWIFRW